MTADGLDAGPLDTSVFIATERGRALAELPNRVALSVVTIGELQLGVFHAGDTETRARRADTLALARAADPIPISEAVMVTWARLVADCRAAGVHRTVKLTDALIAATAIEHGLPVITHDAAFDRWRERVRRCRWSRCEHAPPSCNPLTISGIPVAGVAHPPGAVVWWKVMSSAVLRLTTGVVVGACSTLVALAVPVNAAPAADGQGYIDSTARCGTPDLVAVFGSTATSRVAICQTPKGGYEYRGVRVRDGAELIAPAARSADGGFTADHGGTTYTVTAKALVVSAGTQVIREEPMVDFHSPQTPVPAAQSVPSTPLPPPLPAEVGGSGR